MERKPYPSDLSNAQRAVLEPLIPPANPDTRPRKHPMRRVVEALLHVVKEGCTWRAVPHDFLVPWWTVHNWFRAWGNDGTWDRLLATLREAVRQKDGREPIPSAASADSQSVKTAEGGEARGTDGGKLAKRRKRHIDYERLVETSESMIKISAIHHMLRRLKPKRGRKKFRFKRPVKAVAA